MMLADEYSSVAPRRADAGSAYQVRRDESRGSLDALAAGRRAGSAFKKPDGRNLFTGGMPRSRVRQPAQPVASFDDVLNGFS